MRRIALHDYLSQIEGLLDDNRLPEAAAHCHFVLQQYPRHIGAYRLFGRALLEQQLYDDAIDIFERLLGADPEDLISHAGLALAYSESRDLERAIWHMERAFEVDPYNRAI
ncbi:MAG: tetratricopeptide repeat protein, partial [Chloroflexota bacterium]